MDGINKFAFYKFLRRIVNTASNRSHFLFVYLFRMVSGSLSAIVSSSSFLP